MTSDPTRSDVASASLPTNAMTPSAATSAPSLLAANPAAFALALRQAQVDRVASTLSSLGAIEGPSPRAESYADFRGFCIANSVHYLMPFRDGHAFLPVSLPIERLQQARADLARGDPANAAEIKSALYQLWLMTRHERIADEDRNAKLAIYAKTLCLYDRGAVLLALSELSQSSEWFPPWADLVSRVESHMGLVANLLTALRIAIATRTATA